MIAIENEKIRLRNPIRREQPSFPLDILSFHFAKVIAIKKFQSRSAGSIENFQTRSVRPIRNFPAGPGRAG
jgi:hypothetical protein